MPVETPSLELAQKLLSLTQAILESSKGDAEQDLRVLISERALVLSQLEDATLTSQGKEIVCEAIELESQVQEYLTQQVDDLRELLVARGNDRVALKGYLSQSSASNGPGSMV